MRSRRSLGIFLLVLLAVSTARTAGRVVPIQAQPGATAPPGLPSCSSRWPSEPTRPPRSLDLYSDHEYFPVLSSLIIDGGTTWAQMRVQ